MECWTVLITIDKHQECHGLFSSRDDAEAYRLALRPFFIKAKPGTNTKVIQIFYKQSDIITLPEIADTLMTVVKTNNKGA